MNVVWMAGLTLIVLVERCLEDHRFFDFSLSALLLGMSGWRAFA